MLPGRMAPLKCEVSEFGVISIADCAGVEDDLSAIAKTLSDFSEGVSLLFPGIAARRINIELIPDNIGIFRKVSSASRADMLDISFSFRAPKGRGVYLSAMARTIVHEMVHVAFRDKRINRREAEFVASLAETCVEQQVLGASKGYAFENEMDIADTAANSASARDSVLGARMAYDALLAYAQDGVFDTRIEPLCHSTFVTTGRRPIRVSNPPRAPRS